MQHNQQPDVEYFPNKKPLDIDDTSVTMQPSINESKTQIHVKKARSWFKRINHVLEDKSKKSLTTESDAGSTVVDANSGHHRILKRALNIIFVTIGVFLLLAVIVVIIYTIVIDSQSSSNSTQGKSESKSNEQYESDESSGSGDQVILDTLIQVPSTIKPPTPGVKFDPNPEVRSLPENRNFNYVYHSKQH
ncbi:uncharacterized protein LOC141909697 isoform X1 [Tubulanus polymorphus]|uniref:uncharacterized protein LOC141909697 isoform X1 n=1 Tax=Tubulanus polymorphus TaxID=672921 RepID=UPI003DA5EA6E